MANGMYPMLRPNKSSGFTLDIAEGREQEANGGRKMLDANSFQRTSLS